MTMREALLEELTGRFWTKKIEMDSDIADLVLSIDPDYDCQRLDDYRLCVFSDDEELVIDCGHANNTMWVTDVVEF